jgi:hypothetical protein
LGIAEANKAVSEFLEALSSESSDSEDEENLKNQPGFYVLNRFTIYKFK